jgi:glutamyl-tRNA synthetase
MKASADVILRALPELQPRARTVVELIEQARFLYAARPLALDATAEEQLTVEARAMLADMKKRFAALEEWSAPVLDSTARAFAETHGLKLGKVAQPIRAALTGRTVSPGVFEVMVLLGRDETLARLGDQTNPPRD